MSKNLLHLGDPCIYCGVPHDEVEIGDCPGKITSDTNFRSRFSNDEEYIEYLETQVNTRNNAVELLKNKIAQLQKELAEKDKEIEVLDRNLVNFVGGTPCDCIVDKKYGLVISADCKWHD